MGLFRKWVKNPAADAANGANRTNSANGADASNTSNTANQAGGTAGKAPVNDPRFAAYTGLAEGTIIENSSPMMNVFVITVQYNVAGTDYTIQDMVRYTEPQIHSFEFPRKRTPLLPSVDVGARVPVGYMPDNPQLAYIIGNQEAAR